MFRLIRKEERHEADYGWLKTNWLFSFSDYYDPENVEFGNLRVFNDDVIAPNGGFPEHFHQHMEIVTIILSGEITHTDTLGNSSIIKEGEVQRMSAGPGIKHSEFNRGKKPLHLYQIWFRPDNHGPAYYEQKSVEVKKNTLTTLVSKTGDEGVVAMNACAVIIRGDFQKEKKVHYSIPKARGLFIYVEKGELKIENKVLKEGDQARISEEGEVLIFILEDSRFILIEVDLS